MIEYDKFISNKTKAILGSGFDAVGGWEWLYPFQEYTVKKALKSARYAIFGDCGLGKSRMQLTWAIEVANRTNKPVLILAPLAVVDQTIVEGIKVDIIVDEYFKICDDETILSMGGVFISNYEQLDNIDCSIFGGIVLDESSILKNFTGATRNKLVEAFSDTEYRLCCTATPSPNDELELGNHSEFLGYMTSQDMRAMFFTTDKEIIKGNKYRLKNHAISEFYRWVSTWALMISKPSDIGFSDEGYDLPPLKYHSIEIITPKKDNGSLHNDIAVSATSHHGELRETMALRMAEVVKLINGNSEQWIVWIIQDEEGEYLRKLIPEAIEVSGSDKPATKKKNLLGFANNEFRVLITKAKIGGFGLNYQNCHNQVFPSPDFSFEKLYQMVRRSYRFGQEHQVNVYIINTDTMQNVIGSIKEKEVKFEQMKKEMQLAMNYEYSAELKDFTTKTIEGDNFKLINGDCVEVMRTIETESIDYCFFSPPFGAMYVFSNDPKDFSNVRDNDEMYDHFKYLIPEIYRAMKSGRLVSMHVMQSTTLLGRDGYYSIKDFRGDLIRLFQYFGFYFHAEVMIRKDPKTAAIRTKNRQLMHGTTKTDSSIVRPGLADYIITFRKQGENKIPIQNNLPFDVWCKIAEPVWIDIEESDTVRYMDAKDAKDERHITPTQKGAIKNCYSMWVNKGETVLSPFSGVASEGVVAIDMGMKYIGIELKESYFNSSVTNLKNAEALKMQKTLF